jgi:hypothetical protein
MKKFIIEKISTISFEYTISDEQLKEYCDDNNLDTNLDVIDPYDLTIYFDPYDLKEEEIDNNECIGESYWVEEDE